MATHPGVRTTDPETSYQAALKAGLGASRIRPVVLEILRERGAMTHDEIISAYHMRMVAEPDTPRSSESGLRTRVKELVAAGLVRRSAEKSTSSFGNPAMAWEAIDRDEVIRRARSVSPAQNIAQPADGFDEMPDTDA